MVSCRAVAGKGSRLTFQPEDVREVPLGLVRDSVEHPLPLEQPAASISAIARSMPTLSFLALVVGSFSMQFVIITFYPIYGRAYAIECRTDQGKWRGFEFIFRVTCREKTALMQNGLLNQLDRVFGNRLEHVWIGEDGELSAISDSLFQTRRSLNEEFRLVHGGILLVKKRTGLRPIMPRRVGKRLLSSGFTKRNWLVVSVSPTRSPKDWPRSTTGLRSKRPTECLKLTGWEDDVSAINLLRNAIDDWDVELEALGFLSVNGGLLLASNAR